MTRRVLLGASLLLGLSACSLPEELTALPERLSAMGGVAGPASENREACEAYVAYMNTLEPCMNISYDADNLCSGVDGTDVDMVPYYECLQSHASCQGAEPVLELEGCIPPTIVTEG